MVAGVLTLVGLLIGGPDAVFQPPFPLLAAFAVGALGGFAIVRLRR